MQTPEQTPAPKTEISRDVRFIESAIALHNKIFNETEPSMFNDILVWKKKISEGGYFVAATTGEEVMGYAVCDITPEGEFKVWLAGVNPEMRGRGLWSQLFANIVEFAKAKGYKHVLLNTFPKKFPMMFSFLQKMHAEIYKEEEIDGYRKVYTKIKI